MRPSDVFATADLFDGSNVASVIKNILALGQLSAGVREYHGPVVAVGRGKVWEQAEAVVDTNIDLSSVRIGAARGRRSPSPPPHHHTTYVRLVLPSPPQAQQGGRSWRVRPAPGATRLTPFRGGPWRPVASPRAL